MGKWLQTHAPERTSFKNCLSESLHSPLLLTFAPAMQNSDDKLKKIISHCKEYGFVYPSSEIYDGLSATYDYGPYGSELKNNIRQIGGNQ